MDGLRNGTGGGKPLALLKKALFYAAVLISLYHLWVAWATVRSPLLHRAVHVGSLLALYYAWQLVGHLEKKKLAACALDAFFILAGCGALLYNCVNIGWMESRIAFASALPLAGRLLAAACVVMVFDATRRTLGWGLPVIAGVLLLYAYFGKYMPGWLYHKGASLNRILDLMYFTPEGIFGSPVAATSTYVMVFVLFGAFFAASGAGAFMMKFSNALVGTARGGPAKIAVLSSALFGSINGSPVANTVTTGAVTIPMMKKMGYSGAFAGAVEATASTGGAILPPIMGSAAFLMVELTGTPYSELVLRGLIPGLLFYLCVMAMVDNEAMRLSLKGVRREDLPPLGKTLREGAQFLLPLAIMFFLVIRGVALMRVGLITILLVVAASYLRRDTRMSLKQIAGALESGARIAVSMVAACALAGVIIGSIGMTGLGGKITSMALALTGGHALPTFLLTAVVCIVFGMGMTLPAAYLLTASLMAPALIQIGVDRFVAHFFIIYFATASAITPPVAVASYAAAGIAGVKPNQVGWKACYIGLGLFLLPFAFGFNYSLLAFGDGWHIAISIVTTLAGLVGMQSGISGYMWRRLRAWERMALVGAGLLTMFPSTALSLAGALAVAGVFLLGKRGKGRGEDASIIP